jgi:hypothetical protein
MYLEQFITQVVELVENIFLLAHNAEDMAAEARLELQAIMEQQVQPIQVAVVAADQFHKQVAQVVQVL